MKTITRDKLLEDIKPLIIAGPCAIESEAQIRTIAEKLHRMGIKILRCQLWKPRTDPESFQGIGLTGLKYIKKIKKEFGLLIATEITDKDQVAQTLGIVDILWVGARNMQNYELLKVIGKDDRPVIFKRGLIATVDEWIKAAKYIGHDRVILCERGIRTGADSMRFTLDLNGALVAKHDYNMPVIIDPSHTAGRADMVPYLALAAIAAGLDGIVVEVHSNPEKALSDASQQVTPEVFALMLENINTIHKLSGRIPKLSVKNGHLKKGAVKKTRTLLSLAVINRVGILKDILTIFADFDINLNMLKSNESVDKNFDYIFRIETEATLSEPRMKQALAILKKLVKKIEILKEY